MSDKVKYPTFARTKPTASQISASVVCILKKFNWKKVTFIHTANEENGLPDTVATIESVSIYSAYCQSVTVYKLFFAQENICDFVKLPYLTVTYLCFHKHVSTIYVFTVVSLKFVEASFRRLLEIHRFVET